MGHGHIFLVVFQKSEISKNAVSKRWCSDNSLNCYISFFVAIGSAFPEKKIFEGFLPYMGMAAILVM